MVRVVNALIINSTDRGPGRVSAFFRSFDLFVFLAVSTTAIVSKWAKFVRKTSFDELSLRLYKIRTRVVCTHYNIGTSRTRYVTFFNISIIRRRPFSSEF